MPATTRSNQVAANAAEDVDANADNVEEIEEEIYADENYLDEEEPRRVRSRGRSRTRRPTGGQLPLAGGQVPRDVTGGHIDVRNLHTLRSFKLNDDNWLKWAKATRLIFEIYQLWEGVVYRPNIEARDYTMKNMSAILVITSGLEDHLLSHVSSMAHASEMWDLLKDIGDRT